MSKIIPAGTKIHVILTTGFQDPEERINCITCQDYDHKELANICQNMAEDNAESYGIKNANYMMDDELDKADEDGTEYSYNIDGDWEYYDEEKHSGYFLNTYDEDFQNI